MTRRVVITGMGGISSIGSDWTTIESHLKEYKNRTIMMPEWDIFQGLRAKLGAPILDYEVPSYYPRKKIRGMSRVSLLATTATEKALKMAVT